MLKEKVVTGFVVCCRCSCKMGEVKHSVRGKKMKRVMTVGNYGPFLMTMQVDGEKVSIKYDDVCKVCNRVLFSLFGKAGKSLRGQGKKLAKLRREKELKNDNN